MRRETFDELKAHKSFYRNCFRNANKAVLISVMMSILCGLGIFYKVITIPQPDYYATNGMTAPIQLKALERANMSAQPLMENDPPEEMSVNLLPAGT